MKWVAIFYKHIDIIGSYIHKQHKNDQKNRNKQLHWLNETYKQRKDIMLLHMLPKIQQNPSQIACQSRMWGKLTHVCPLASLSDWVILQYSFEFSLLNAIFSKILNKQVYVWMLRQVYDTCFTVKIFMIKFHKRNLCKVRTDCSKLFSMQ